MEKGKTHTNRFFERFSLFIILLAGIVLVGYFIVDSRNTTNQNNGYARTINCILSVPATTRTKADIDNCYTQVENDLGIKLQRHNSLDKENK